MAISSVLCHSLNSIVLHHTTLQYITIHWTALHYNTLNCTALYCTSTHQAVFMHCTVYSIQCYTGSHQFVHVSCRCSSGPWGTVSGTLHCTALHCTALHCTTLHCTALHWTILNCNSLQIAVLYYTELYWGYTSTRGGEYSMRLRPNAGIFCTPRLESRYRHYPIYKSDEAVAIAIAIIIIITIASA